MENKIKFVIITEKSRDQNDRKTTKQSQGTRKRMTV